MVNPRATAAVSSSSSSSSSPSSTAQINTAYSLSLISEYGHILDSLPLDLSRGIGELRELDAVLSSSMITFTAKVHSLTCMIEERRGTKEERLYLLHEISEEAARLKCGGDDKIRAACTAADALRSHVIHLHTLAERMPEFDMTSLKRRTIYPHVSDKSFMPLNMDAGRRRRGGTSGLLSNPNAVDPSPAKRKRLPRDEEIDISSGRSPHKRERLLGGDSTNPRSRLGRGKKNERIPSPSESLVSVTSHLPLQNPNGSSSARAGPSSTHTSALTNLNTSGRNANGAVAGSKRRGQGGGAVNNTSNTTNTNNRVSTPLSTNDYPSHHSNSASTASHRGPNGVASSHHPSNSSSIPGYSNGTGNGNGGLVNGNAGHFNNGTGGDHTNSVSGSPDLNIPSNQLLAGPGIVPHARSASVHSNATNANGAFGVGGGGRNSHNANLNAADGEGTDGGIGDAGDVDGDNDDNRTYCYCDGVSYGEMIACDDENCEREWFHLSCIGLTVCPEGSWFCDTCKNKRNNKRSGRGGKRRAAGNRTGGKA